MTHEVGRRSGSGRFQNSENGDKFKKFHLFGVYAVLLAPNDDHIFHQHFQQIRYYF